MQWTTPDFVEIKMDAEIGSYQEDYEPLRDDAPIASSGVEDALRSPRGSDS